jgi:phage-related baseplate assembly protein
MLADLRARDPVFTALTEADPAYKILEVAAFRETIIRARVNDAAKAVMLPYAAGANLDQLAALYGLTRNVIDPGDPEAVPPVAPAYETDAALRARILLSLDGLSTAGPTGAYKYHALSVAGVLDANATSPAPGQVLVSVLGSTGDGTPSVEILAAVQAALSDESVRPLTDQVSVAAAAIVPFTVTAALTLYAGPDSAVVLATAQAAVADYVSRMHRIGNDVTLSGLYAALNQPGVMRVDLSAPAENLVITPTQASYCTAISVTVAGRGQ